MPFRQHSITLIINAGKTLRLVAKKNRQYVLMKRRFTIIMPLFLFASVQRGGSDNGRTGIGIGAGRAWLKVCGKHTIIPLLNGRNAIMPVRVREYRRDCGWINVRQDGK
ncbi:hypothetical protein OHJ28_15730 [Dickeya fangzhongdai]|uniref:hypothetical protein n=1 Tax=Dickeya fangzhongdai TaxID=1778540 RepID=UPI0013F772AC|nr:hypothetical protein [Dickeya fangzhongdai]UMB75550.1 hypothetical protein FXN80_15725 [Dickeya fangzhongdai]